MPAVREAVPDDAPLLLRLIQESFQTVYDRFGIGRDWPRHAANLQPVWILEQVAEGNRFFVLEEAGRACGCVAIQGPGRRGAGPDDAPDDPTVHIRRLAVLPADRRRGHGRMLVEHVLAEARRRGARRAVLTIIAADVELRRWYERMGFVATETRRDPDMPFQVTRMAMDL
ncbi:MAG: GNAT family N-acetyltransferase [Planctomycetes bacterium]|nr:GNAT family N-acetyltransferase [Planctomycetota bacterium]